MRLLIVLSFTSILFVSLAAFCQNTPPTTQPAVPPESNAAPAASSVLKNSDIISMAEAGLSNPIIIAKIKASEVDFDTSTQALVELSKKGIAQEIVTEMIARPKGAPASSDAANPYMSAYSSAMAQANNMMSSIQHPVTLVADGKSVVIDPLTGRAQAVNAFFKVMVYMVYEGSASSLRIKQTRPEIRVKSNGNPGGHFYLVKTESLKKDKSRSVKVGSGYFKYESGPDKDWCIEVAINKLNENEWSLVPVADLKPGEYGVFNGYQLFDFAVAP